MGSTEPPHRAADTRDVIGALIAASWPLMAVAARALAAAEPELSLVQYRALVLLDARGVGDARTMAAFARADPRAMRCMVEWLSEVGLVERAPASKDEREPQWRLTVAGRRVVRRVGESRRRQLARVVQAIPLELRVGLAAGLRAWTTAGGALSADVPGPLD